MDRRTCACANRSRPHSWVLFRIRRTSCSCARPDKCQAVCSRTCCRWASPHLSAYADADDSLAAAATFVAAVALVVTVVTTLVLPVLLVDIVATVEREMVAVAEALHTNTDYYYLSSAAVVVVVAAFRFAFAAALASLLLVALAFDAAFDAIPIR